MTNKLDPDDAEAHRNLGTAYAEQGRWEEPVAAYEKAVELAPNLGEAYGDMVTAYINLGKLSEAIAVGEKSIELAPDYAMRYNNLAVVYGMQGQIDQAVALLTQAIQVDPDCADAHYNLALAYEKMGGFAPHLFGYDQQPLLLRAVGITGGNQVTEPPESRLLSRSSLFTFYRRDDIMTHKMTRKQEVVQPNLRGLLMGKRATTLIGDLLERGVNVLLTPTWIAQAQKAHSQQMFMTVERDVLWPMVKQLMVDLLAALADDDARVWAGTALTLLNEEEGAGAVAERVSQVLKDPAATPRGHYEEGMHGYFRGLQFLIKSVFDVKLNPLWCQPIRHFVFPWSALSAILETLRAHPDLRRRWEDLHRFYTVATGEPDCVSIRHLLDLPEVQKETVVSLTRELDVPRINRKMGIGVQGLAERFTRHGLTFEHLKETFLPDVTKQPIPRESVYAVVNMRSLLYGFEHPVHGESLPMLLDGQVGGLLEALSAVRGRPVEPFFDQFLMAQYELVADLPAPEVAYLAPRLDPAVDRLDPTLRRRLNAFAANLTSLLELAILSAKQPMKMVMRSAMAFTPPPREASIYVEAAPPAFFGRLGQMEQTVTDLCEQMVQKYGPRRRGRLYPTIAPRDFAAIYRILADLSEGGEFISKNSREWRIIAPLVERLERDPNVTADAYRHVDETEGQYFLQWCTAMASFEARVTDGTLVKGGELLFVEGWNDAITPGREEPLTNSAWREALSKTSLTDWREWTPAPIS